MAGFMGGSAWAMARDITEGYVLVTERLVTRMKPQELDQLTFEMNRKLREIRGAQPDLQDLEEIQGRNRRIQRLTAALGVIQHARNRRRI